MSSDSRNNGRAQAHGAVEVDTDPERLDVQIDALTRENRSDRAPELDRRLLRLRHLAGVRLLDQAAPDPEYAEPDYDALPNEPGVVEVAPGDLTPGLLRAAILRHGCLLVRGLVDRGEALALADRIDAAFEARAAAAAEEEIAEGSYEPFRPEPPMPGIEERPWVEMGGGVLAVDAPPVMFEMFEALDRVGFRDLVEGYLGEPGAISAQKTTLRKAEPDVAGAWHQDGKFLGDVRALNLWLSLSRCGDESPGLDIVPRRIDDLLESGGEGIFPIQVDQALAERAAGDLGIQRPIFEPGDALLFDDRFLHKTGSDPEMPKPRYAIESWFFGPSAFPGDYAPLAA